MKNYIDDYINYIFIEKKLSNNTKYAYQNDLNDFSKFLNNKEISKISTIDIKNYISHLSNINDKDKTIARKIVSIRTFFDYLMKNNIINTNPCEKIESIKLKKALPKTLNKEDIDKLLSIKVIDAKTCRNKAMIELMYSSGLRVSELVNLNLNNVNLDDDYVRVYGKGKKERIIPIATSTSKLLDTYINIYRNSLLKGYLTDKLFISSYGKGITRQGFFKILKKIANEKLNSLDTQKQIAVGKNAIAENPSLAAAMNSTL